MILLSVNLLSGFFSPETHFHFITQEYMNKLVVYQSLTLTCKLQVIF